LHPVLVYVWRVPSTVAYAAIMVRYRRKLAGMSLTSLALELGITVAQLRSYEEAQEPIPPSVLSRMAELLDCSVTEFFTEAPKLH